MLLNLQRRSPTSNGGGGAEERLANDGTWATGRQTVRLPKPADKSEESARSCDIDKQVHVP